MSFSKAVDFLACASSGAKDWDVAESCCMMMSTSALLNCSRSLLGWERPLRIFDVVALAWAPLTLPEEGPGIDPHSGFLDFFAFGAGNSPGDRSWGSCNSSWSSSFCSLKRKEGGLAFHCGLEQTSGNCGKNLTADFGNFPLERFLGWSTDGWLTFPPAAFFK